MVKSPKISLIIPVYNVEQYLPECLDSCINQTLNEIEILCIDDCSKDGSVKIIKKYCKKDPRIKLISHDVNKGLGAARNTGIENARGEYIWFIDSDDFIDLNSCQLFYDNAHNNNCDLLLFQGKSFYDDKKGRTYIIDDYYNDFLKNKNFSIKDYKYNGENIPVSACMYISRLSFLKNFSFREKVYYEDTDFSPILFWSASSIRSIPYSAYNRRVTPNSITQSPMSEKKLFDKLAVCKSLKNFIISNNIPKDNYLHKFYSGYITTVYSDINNNANIFDLSNKEYLELKKDVIPPFANRAFNKVKRMLKGQK